MTEALVEQGARPAAALTPRGVLDGRWRVIARVGHGAFGQVYRAVELESQEEVAIKVFNPQLDATGYVQELGLLFSEHHPNIVRTRSFGYNRAGRYIVYEFVAGGSLRDYLIRFPRVQPEQALAMLEGMARGLAFAHERRVVHRDLKPENILLTRDTWPFEVKLCDFGLSTRVRGETKMRSRYGSPGYMAPEQFEAEYDHRVDFYALGVILYELLFGRRPFTGDYVSIRHAHKHREIPLPQSAPPALLALLRRMLHVDPRQRHDDADALLTDIIATRRALDTARDDTPLSPPRFDEPVIAPRWRVTIEEPLRQATTTRSGHLLLSTSAHVWAVLRDGRAIRLVELNQQVDEWIEGGSIQARRVGWASQGQLWLLEQDRVRALPGVSLEPGVPCRMRFTPDVEDVLLITPSHVELRGCDGEARWRAQIASYGALPPVCCSRDGQIVWIAQEAPRTQLVALTRDGERLSRTAAGGNEVKLAATIEDRVLVGVRGQRELVELSAQGFVTRELSLWEPLLDLVELGDGLALACSARHLQLLDLRAFELVAIERHPDPSMFTIYGAGGLYLMGISRARTTIERFALTAPREDMP